MCAKRLFLIRHAKSSWKFSSLADHQRPLNNRGKRDAPFMGGLLKNKNVKPDLIVSSHAERAKQTAFSFAASLGYPEKHILISQRLYEASYIEIIDIINETDNDVMVLLVFGHNPGLTTLHNIICDKYIDNIPTCGITEYEFNGNWNQLNASTCKLISFEFPKKYFT